MRRTLSSPCDSRFKNRGGELGRWLVCDAAAVHKTERQKKKRNASGRKQQRSCLGHADDDCCVGCGWLSGRTTKERRDQKGERGEARERSVLVCWVWHPKAERANSLAWAWLGPGLVLATWAGLGLDLGENGVTRGKHQNGPKPPLLPCSGVVLVFSP